MNKGVIKQGPNALVKYSLYMELLTRPISLCSPLQQVWQNFVSQMHVSQLTKRATFKEERRSKLASGCTAKKPPAHHEQQTLPPTLPHHATPHHFARGLECKC
jgi:hypothetical protein